MTGHKPTTYYVTVSVFLLMIAGLGFLLWMMVLDIKQASGNVVSDAEAQLLAEQQSQAIDTFTKTYADRKVALDSLSQYFVDPQDPIDFIKFLEGAAATSNASISVTLLPSQNATAQAAAFQLGLKGSFGSILSFMQAVEYGPYLVSISSANVRKEESTGPAAIAKGTLDADIILQVQTK